MTRLVAMIALSAVSLSPSVRAGDVTIDRGQTTAVIRLGDEILGTYRFGKELPKPYLIAVSAPDSLGVLAKALKGGGDDAARQAYVAVEHSTLKTGKADDPADAPFGTILTVTEEKDGWFKVAGKEAWVAGRDVVPVAAMVTRIVNPSPPEPPVKDKKNPLYYDHLHHKGVWVSVDEVNKIKFWAEGGRIENAAVDVVKASGDPAVLKVTNHWLDTDGRPLLIENTAIAIHANRLFVYEISFAAAGKPVEFGDTKEGMFAMRLPNSMRELIAGGPVTSKEGVEGTANLWGKPAGWINYIGPIGDNKFGVTVMDDPKNPRASRYHVRDYGLFAVNPFGQAAYTETTEKLNADLLHLEPGEEVRFRYGLFIHAGDTSKDEIDRAYRQFQSPPEP